MTTKDEVRSTVEALKLALDALEETRNALAWFYDSYPEDVTPKGNELLPHVEVVLADLRVALTSNSLALEQPAQQEPVAWIVEDQNGERLEWAGDVPGCVGLPTFPLYTTPPNVATQLAAPVQEPVKDSGVEQDERVFSRISAIKPAAQRPVVEPHKWVGLTDEELELLNDCGDTDSYKFARAIEAKLKEKNGF